MPAHRAAARTSRISLTAMYARIAGSVITGSAAVGKWLRANCGLKKLTLELGNNSALIVDAGADLDLAVARTVIGGFSHSGQVCISVQRIYVHDSLADRFAEALKAAVEKLNIGHPLEEGTDHSSLVSESAAQRVESWVKESIADGGRLVTGLPSSRMNS